MLARYCKLRFQSLSLQSDNLFCKLLFLQYPLTGCEILHRDTNEDFGPQKGKKKEKKYEKIDVATMYVSKWLSSPLFRCELSSIRISVCGCPLPPVDYMLDVDYDDICRHGASPQWHFYLSSSSNRKRWCVNTRVSTMNVGCPIDTHISTICFTRPPWKYLREIRVRGKVQWAIDIRSCRAQWKPFQSSVLERLITTMNNSTEVLLASARV